MKKEKRYWKLLCYDYYHYWLVFDFVAVVEEEKKLEMHFFSDLVLRVTSVGNLQDSLRKLEDRVLRWKMLKKEFPFQKSKKMMMRDRMTLSLDKEVDHRR